MKQALGMRQGRALTASISLATAAVCGIGATAAASVAPARSPHSFGAVARSVTAAAAQRLTQDWMLSAGQVGSRSQVPWRLVGPGWTLAQFTTGTYSAARPVTLYLIDPAGGRYRMYQRRASHAPWQLVDWSPDKRRALFVKPVGGRQTLHQLVLATGKVTTFRLPAATDHVLGYTRPNGDNILVSDHGIARFSLTGAFQAQLVRGKGFNAAISAPNGLTEVTTGRTGVKLVRNTGGVIRQLPVPGADPKLGKCNPVRWWSSATALVGCTPNTGRQRLWLVPVSGAAPTAVTALRGVNSNDFGDLDAWKFRSGLYVQALGACGTIFIGKQAASGSVAVVNVPGSSGNNVVAATSGNRMLVREFSECNPSSSLVWFSPASRAVTKVLTAPANGDGVLSVVAYNRNGQEP